ncbi:MAG TPA: MarR family transcriptional regulator, partial [Coriobacteriia bacterium]|nr:MarR family transcriptional regulator [Coriobacteriia bacterium]
MAHPARGTTLWLALWRTSRDVQRLAEANIAESGLCLTDFGVLEALLNGGPQRVNTVAEKVMLTSGSMTTAVDRLAAKGLVARAADETDARARVVELTDAGRAVIGPAFARHAEYLDDIFGDMTDEER